MGRYCGRLVQSNHRREVLRRVVIPASVRPHSMVVYGILGEVPSELIVRTHGGKTVVDENIRSLVSQIACA